ncbi:hypothetical protein AB0E04_44000 [Streptomyces sp. NPDC048251]|uniref:hypothetical protein n=1 Tax=Streptomyces sp. NPDC048251 TaxID=3154501 RepID=UPI00342E457E
MTAFLPFFARVPLLLWVLLVVVLVYLMLIILLVFITLFSRKPTRRRAARDLVRVLWFTRYPLE